jgi:hypothetical protein
MTIILNQNILNASHFIATPVFAPVVLR